MTGTPTRPLLAPPVPLSAAPSRIRHHVLGTVRAGIRELAEKPTDPGHGEHLHAALRDALAAAETGDDGTDGCAAPAIRTACVHLAAQQTQEAYLALLCAQDQFGGS